MKVLKTFLFALFLLIAVSPIFAQQSARDRGIDLFNQGKAREAVLYLEDAVKQKEFKTDPEAWNFLGLSYEKTRSFKKAVKALKKAVELAPQRSIYRLNLAYVYVRGGKANEAQKEAGTVIKAEPNNASAYLLRGSAYFVERKLDETIADCEKVISINPSYAAAYTLKSNALVGRLGRRLSAGSTLRAEIGILKEAVETLQAGEKNSEGDLGMAPLKEELEGLSEFYKYFTREKNLDANMDPNGVGSGPNVTPLKIISKPRANYTDAARQANTQGNIKIAILFAASGEIRHVLVLEGLPYGLSEEAVKAARAIRFEPEKRDGKPVPVVKMVMYGFSIY
jgi:TonB family protein